MSNYNKTIWQDGDLITEENLNKIENQLETVTDMASGAVSYNRPQSFNSLQLAQLWSNLGSAPGSYVIETSTQNGLAEFQPAANSIIKLHFIPPTDNYEGKAWLVSSNLLALFGLNTDTLTFAAGQKDIVLTNEYQDLPCVDINEEPFPYKITAHYLAPATKRMSYNLNAANNLPLWNQSLMSSTQETDTTLTQDVLIYQDGIHSLKITRTDDEDELEIDSPILTYSDSMTFLTSRIGTVQEIDWSSENCDIEVRANSNDSHWLIIRKDNDNVATCEIKAVGNSDIKFKSIVNKITELENKLIMQENNTVNNNNFTDEYKNILDNLIAENILDQVYSAITTANDALTLAYSLAERIEALENGGDN